jgi:mannose-6-phosphate isomerase-like protein (cupin superfamily)
MNCNSSVFGGTVQPGTNYEDWPEELDALIAAPKHHRLLFENEAVRVLDTRVAPGETVPLHMHRWPSSLYIMSWSDFVRREGDGVVVVDSRTGIYLPEGSAHWSPPLAPHTLENVGTSELRAISVEVKDDTRSAG